jgi:hypothetical protein
MFGAQLPNRREKPVKRNGANHLLFHQHRLPASGRLRRLAALRPDFSRKLCAFGQ